MSLKDSINRLRRIIMHALTSGIGNQKRFQTAPDDVHRILVSRPNARLGNQLLITPLLQELATVFPNAKTDLFVRGSLAHVLFQNYTGIDRIIELPGKPFNHLITYFSVWLRLLTSHYDLAVNAESGSSTGRLSIKFTHAKYKVYDLTDPELQKRYADYRHMAKHPVYTLRKQLGQEISRPIQPLSVKLTSEEKNQGRNLLQKFVGNQKKTICLYTYATGGKCYSKQWWKNLHQRLQQHLQNRFNIIEILPKENVSQIDFAVPHFYSTNIRELAAFISASDFFISADCGMMHLATASGTTTLGLFSSTNPLCYAPYGRQNIALDTNKDFLSKLFACIDSNR